MKKTLYMVQVNASFDSSIYLPYAAGTLIASAMNNDELNGEYDFEEIIYLRSEINSVLAELKTPYIMAFSNYIWNFEYNKALAKKVKEKYPECLIVFGGHNVPCNGDLLSELPFVDILMFGEGEQTFCNLLMCLKNNADLNSVNNIAYRTTDNEIVCTDRAYYTDIDYPSPYTMGVFDSIVKNSAYSFSAILETNRGCPYSCAFCDWGFLRSKIRQFPIERVLGDLKWMSDNKIEYCYCADSNFGIFDRDLDIIDNVIDLYKTTGYPQKFRVNYMKNSDEKVFEINKRLYEAGMNKGVTLSFQSLCPETLEIIGRKNITMSHFKKWLQAYKQLGISAYSELILGLPGETYESFKNGVEQLLEAGQHSSIFIYNCELLVNSKLGDKNFRKQYEIETVKIPFNQDHFALVSDSIQEYSNIIVSTSSMKREDWVRTATFSVFMQALHCLGLLQCVAIYLFNENKISYTNFYSDFFKALYDNNGVCGKICRETVEKLNEYSKGNGMWSYYNETFGNISWPVEEGLFLRFEQNYEQFYSFAKDFLAKYIKDESVLNDLVKYQCFVLKKHTDNSDLQNFEYDFNEYFEKIALGEYENLKKTKCAYSKETSGYESIDVYAKEVIWFGRRSSSTLSENIKKSDNK